MVNELLHVHLPFIYSSEDLTGLQIQIRSLRARHLPIILFLFRHPGV